MGSRVLSLELRQGVRGIPGLIVPLLTPGGIGMMSVTPPSAIGIPADVNNTNGDTFAGNETVLVRDFEGVLAQIDQVFEEIDVRPLQVAIEAMILSVELDDKNSFGVNFQFLRSNQAEHRRSPPANRRPASLGASVALPTGASRSAFSTAAWAPSSRPWKRSAIPT